MKIRTLLRTSARRSALRAGRILIPPPSTRSIPSPHDGEVGRGSGRGDFKRARQFDGPSPSPQPSPRSCLARRGSRRLQQWWVYQDAQYITTLAILFLALLNPAQTQAQTAPSAQTKLNVTRDLPYAEPADPRQKVDIYAPEGAKNLPVVFWIHGGGWQTGDKSDVQVKPQAFADRGFVFVSTGYRLLPNVDLGTIFRDIAKSVRWVHDHIAEHGGDPKRILVMGHSAGAQLAALICIDDRYLKAEGLSLAIIKGCVPVDGDTYDVPAIIETAETRLRVHGLPMPRFGHREKFGNDPAKHRDYSAVTHVAPGKGIPPFLILHVADHPDTSAQAQRLGNVLKDAGVPVTVFGAKETTHNKINADLGLPDDPATKALF